MKCAITAGKTRKMQNKDVLAVLDYLNIPYEDPNGKNEYESNYSYNHSVQYEKILGRLMNVTLQCLGAIRNLAIEEEKARISDDCADVSGDNRISGNAALVQRQVFCQAVHTMTDTILPARELNQHDPIKELIESFPWSPSLRESNWLMLNWAMMTPFMEPPVFGGTIQSQHQSILTSGTENNPIPNEDPNASAIELQESVQPIKPKPPATTPKDHHYLVKQILSYYPNSISEIDKFGQTYLSYVVRCQSLPILEDVLKYHKQCTRIKDASGRTLIHYLIYYSPTLEALLLVCEHLGISLKKLCQSPSPPSPNNDPNHPSKPVPPISQLDDYGNNFIHTACLGVCDVAILQELLFCCPDAVKQLNNDGQLPLHCLCLHHSQPTPNELAKARLLLSAYPPGYLVRDSKGWLPIQYAVYHHKNLELIKGLLSYGTSPLEMLKISLTSGRIALHYACVHCYSSKVIQYLLQLYPDGAKCMDENQRLPLHTLIARCDYLTPSRIRCLRLLLEAYPAGASMRDKDGHTPYDLAMRDGQGELILRLLLRAEPSQNPEHLGELSYLASQAKYKATHGTTLRKTTKEDLKTRKAHHPVARAARRSHRQHHHSHHRPVERYAPSQYPRDPRKSDRDQDGGSRSVRYEDQEDGYTYASSSRYSYSQDPSSSSYDPSRAPTERSYSTRRSLHRYGSYRSRATESSSRRGGEESYRSGYSSYDSYDSYDSYGEEEDYTHEDDERRGGDSYTQGDEEGRSATSATAATSARSAASDGGSYSYYSGSTYHHSAADSYTRGTVERENYSQ